MSFTYDLETEIGWIRLMLGDNIENEGVRPGGDNYQDEEIEVFLSKFDQRKEPAFLELIMVLANELSSSATSQRFADFQEEFKNRERELRLQYAAWKSKFQDDITTNPSTIDSVPYHGVVRNVPTL